MKHEVRSTIEPDGTHRFFGIQGTPRIVRGHASAKFRKDGESYVLDIPDRAKLAKKTTKRRDGREMPHAFGLHWEDDAGPHYTVVTVTAG